MRNRILSVVLSYCTIGCVALSSARVMAAENRAGIAVSSEEASLNTVSKTATGSQSLTIEDLKLQLDTQAAQIKELQRRLEEQDSLHGPALSTETSSDCVPEELHRSPVVTEESWEPSCDESDPPRFQKIDYYADYDRGFVIRPFDGERNPFELKVNGWIQFRHHAFSRDVESWTDNSGTTRPVRNRNAFDVERARLVFSGHVIDKRLTYFLQLDGDTDGSHTVDFFDYWWGWKFSDAFKIQMGKRKVSASRQWLLGARRTRFVDRPMANDFFRPDRTIGIWGVGTIGETGHYEVMVGNGYRTSNIPNALTDDRLTFAATNYFDLLGKFGGQVVDYAQSSTPLVRVGHSFAFSPQSDDRSGVPLTEANFTRLSDGTMLVQAGALTPGVTVSQYDVYLYGLDAALKWRGWSINAEAFMRWIEQIEGNGPLSRNDLFQRGYYVEGGYFVIPKKLDVNLRYSQVTGMFGTGSESAAGFNWYPLNTPQMKVSFDVTSLKSSPLQNTTTDILVGNDGLLFRTQFQAEF